MGWDWPWPFKRRRVEAAGPGWVTGAVRSSSGLAVGTHNALRHPGFFSAVRLLSSTVASLPWPVYMRQGRGRVKADWLPLYDALRIRPNPYQTSYQLLEWLVQCLLLDGNAYCAIERRLTRRGRDVYLDVVALHPIDPSRVEVKIDPAGGKTYIVDRQEIAQSAILHIVGYSRDGLVGSSIVHQMADALGMGLAGRQYNAELLANGGMPSVALTTPQPLKQDAVDALKASYLETYGGPQRRGVIVLHNGLDIKPISIKPEDAQLLDSLKLSDLDVARMLGIPPHMLGLIDKASYASIEHQAIEFVQYCLRPWLVRIEQALTAQLLEGPYYVEAVVEGLLRGDVESRYRAYATARQWGWLSINDIRRLENLPEVEGGDRYLEPLNMRAVGEQLELPFEEEEAGR